MSVRPEQSILSSAYGGLMSLWTIKMNGKLHLAMSAKIHLYTLPLGMGNLKLHSDWFLNKELMLMPRIMYVALHLWQLVR